MRLDRTLTPVIGLAIAAVAVSAGAAPVTVDVARAVAAAVAGGEQRILDLTPKPGVAAPLYFVARLAPTGFVLVAADDGLPPVIGYSFDSAAELDGPAAAAVGSLLAADLGARLSQVELLPAQRRADRRDQWRRLASGMPEPLSGRADVWPPPGTTTTGGWVETRWHQSAPYNDQCPLDTVTGLRSLAGCPAIAMAQIVNRHRTHHRTVLDDGDDYRHSYAGRVYWIDDDAAATGFPTFPELSASLATLEQHWAAGLAAASGEAAALVFACGVVARQVFTSSASGTFGVDQARDAYLRLGETGLELLVAADPELHSRLAEEMRAGRPAHLAVVDPAWQSGHNLVVDGYDGSDGRFHLGFGWGGSYDGWYLLPDEMPYGLTVVEGVIVGLRFVLAGDGFESGDLAGWSSSTP